MKKESLNSCLAIQTGCLTLYVISLATSMSGMEFFSTLLCLSVVSCFLIEKRSLRTTELPPFIWPLLLFVGVACVGIVLGGATLAEKAYDFRRMRFFLLYAIFFYMFLLYVKKDTWLWVLFGICGVISVYGFFQHFIPMDLVRPQGSKVILYAIQAEQIGPLVVGTFNHHLTFANVYFLYASLFFALGLSNHPRRIWFLTLGSVLFLLCVWSGSRTAWVAVVVGILLLAFWKNKRFFYGSVVTVCMLLVLSFALDSGFRERLTRTVRGGDTQYGLSERGRLWVAQLYMFKDSPVWGLGYNNSERRSKEYIDRLYPEVANKFYGHAHSTPLQILSSTGGLGFCAYVWLWWQILVSVWRHAKAKPVKSAERWMFLGVFVGFIGFHIQGLTQWNFGDAEVLHNLTFLWAIVGARISRA